MGKLDEIDKLDRAIKDADIRLKSILENIEKIDKEIVVLNPRKVELERNLEFHKKRGTIPLAHEYKATKSELSKAKNRLSMIIGDRAKCEDACLQIERIIQKFKNDYAKLTKTDENNVLRPNFGGKNGKK